MPSWNAIWNNRKVCGFSNRDRGVSIGHDGDGGRSGFSDFSLRATKRQSSAQPVRRDLT